MRAKITITTITTGYVDIPEDIDTCPQVVEAIETRWDKPGGMKFVSETKVGPRLIELTDRDGMLLLTRAAGEDSSSVVATGLGVKHFRDTVDVDGWGVP